MAAAAQELLTAAALCRLVDQVDKWKALAEALSAKSRAPVRELCDAALHSLRLKKVDAVTEAAFKKISVPGTVRPPSTAGLARDEPSTVCYNCRRTGHMAKHCRSPRAYDSHRRYSGHEGQEKFPQGDGHRPPRPDQQQGPLQAPPLPPHQRGYSGDGQ
jgi:hypothetical protein